MHVYAETYQQVVGERYRAATWQYAQLETRSPALRPSSRMGKRERRDASKNRRKNENQRSVCVEHCLTPIPDNFRHEMNKREGRRYTARVMV